MWWRNILSFFRIRRVVDLKCHGDGKIRSVLIVREVRDSRGVRCYGVRGLGVWWGLGLAWYRESDPALGCVRWNHAPLRILGGVGLVSGFIAFAMPFGVDSRDPVSWWQVIAGIAGLIIIAFSAHLFQLFQRKEQKEKGKKEERLFHGNNG